MQTTNVRTNVDSKTKRFVLRKKCWEHVNERSHLPHTGLLMKWREVCWLGLWIQGCRYRSVVVFQSKQQGIWGETEENRRGGFVHILTPFSSHLEEMLRYKWPAWSPLREDCIFYSLRQHMEAIRDQRGSVLSSRRTHKGLSWVWTMCNANVSKVCLGTFVTDVMGLFSQRWLGLMFLWAMGAEIQERCLQV